MLGFAGSEDDFGRYLASVEERDIDLLLMEEFHVSDEFVSWFCTQIGLSGIRPGGAWHSASDTDGETDLLLRVLAGSSRIGVLIENKIKAPEQDQQDRRYHLRGIRSREAGKFDEYLTVMCAPRRYLDGLPSDSAYEHRIEYEAIADWFSRLDGRRAAWRYRVMTEAIDQARRGYVMSVSAMTTEFHRDYWEHLRRRHPRLHMAKPGNKGPKSNWIILKGHDFPKDVKLHHKLDQSVMELGYSSAERWGTFWMPSRIGPTE
ncbi:PD-(D/E)XK nuclease family protein [Mesorhizobium sp. BR1-1-14]|uniref:PD-(D/E)XK nuclease family protein n=1 Tax=Mesorhizobium sp. BR1-1-14 TaxID=2876655 RepID=UPI001CD0473D|nr:PD-(D/E)XK nuclease family protein [Mesorhizobium sp. BR1-1-14]MBZ9960616.1 PD-(D/E)XK nuclease family protein [Mesorhizobium sp. BR1-1-14]